MCALQFVRLSKLQNVQFAELYLFHFEFYGSLYFKVSERFLTKGFLKGEYDN